MEPSRRERYKSRASAPLSPTWGEGLGGYLSAESIPETRLWMKFPECLGSLQLCACPLTPNPSRVGERGTEMHRVFRETKSIVTIFCKRGVVG